MAELPDQIFLATNAALFVIALLLAAVVLILASRHVWLTGYGSEQARVRVWTAVMLILLTLTSIAGAVFNLFFV
jgi:hypothetical protein